MEKKQTAVEWLITQLEGEESLVARIVGLKEYNQIINEAKQMEKEQKRDSFNESRLTNPMIGFKHNNFEQYYNETYGEDNG
jgi:hypothetical protein